jgi:hypothetical protein
MTTLEKAEAAERELMEQLDRTVVKSVIYTSGERDPRETVVRPNNGKLVMMGHDPRLPQMPDRPTLFDFFRLRFGSGNIQHVMQSARLAQKNGASEKIVLACLLHDIAIAGFIRGDHGYWAAQLVEPYVDEEVTWAIRYHQALRFFPDESVGYAYPQMYVKLFGPDYQVEPYIRRDYEYAREHKWYMSARLICINDLYAFDGNVRCELEEFTDVVGRNFKQPKEGLGFDTSPSAHMWRTINWPTKYL